MVVFYNQEELDVKPSKTKVPKKILPDSFEESIFDKEHLLRLIDKTKIAYQSQMDFNVSRMTSATILKQVAIEDFRILNLLGKGGFSRVYLAENRSSGLINAIKVVDISGLFGTKKLKFFKERLLTERNVLASLKHPFIVSL